MFPVNTSKKVSSLQLKCRAFNSTGVGIESLISRISWIFAARVRVFRFLPPFRKMLFSKAFISRILDISRPTSACPWSRSTPGCPGTAWCPPLHWSLSPWTSDEIRLCYICAVFLKFLFLKFRLIRWWSNNSVEIPGFLLQEETNWTNESEIIKNLGKINFPYHFLAVRRSRAVPGEVRRRGRWAGEGHTGQLAIST